MNTQPTPEKVQESRSARAYRTLQDVTQVFTRHPHEAGESYGEHLWFTCRMSVRFALVGFILLVHGLLPFLFTRTASTRIEQIYHIMKKRAQHTHVSEFDPSHDSGRDI